MLVFEHILHGLLGFREESDEDMRGAEKLVEMFSFWGFFCGAFGDGFGGLELLGELFVGSEERHNFGEEDR
jgi:hypothetical protein